MGGSAARSPETTTSSASSFCRFFWRMTTISVAVQAPSATRSISMGPGAELDWRSESSGTACPEGLTARNFSSPAQRIVAVCTEPPAHSVEGRQVKSITPRALATGDPSVGGAGPWVNWRLENSSCQLDVRYTQLQEDKRLTARVLKTTIAGCRERFSSQGNAWRL